MPAFLSYFAPIIINANKSERSIVAFEIFFLISNGLNKGYCKFILFMYSLTNSYIRLKEGISISSFLCLDTNISCCSCSTTAGSIVVDAATAGDVDDEARKRQLC